MQNVSIYRGDDYTINLTFKNSSGVVVNITGYTVFFTLKSNKSDADASAVVRQEITSHTSPTTGQTAIVLASATTATLKGQYYYDIQIKDAGGKITTCEEGIFTFTEDVTVRTSALS